MAVSTVGSVVTHGSTANSGTQTITVPSGAKLAVIFWCGAPSSGGWSMSSISLGGVAGVIRSNVAAVSGTTAAIGSATVENPPAGTQALSWDYTGSATAAVGSAFIVRFFTADGNIVVADWDAAAGGQGSTVQSLTVDSASDGYVVGMAAGALDANGAPTGSGQTIDLDNFSVNNLFADLSHVDSPGASTTTWNMTASQFASGAVVSLMEEPPPPPEPPTGLDVTPASSSELSVTWDTEEGDLSYDVRFRRTDEFPQLSVQSSAPWHLERLSQRTRAETNQYLYGYTGAGVRIYVVDTGVRATHNQFGGRVIAGFNATDGPSSDELGHGTQVASSAAGSTSGTAKGATIVPVKVARTGTAEEVSVDPDYATDYFEGLAWIANNHPSDVRGVVTSSVPLPVGADEEELEQAWQALLDKGLVCVQAAPNDGQQGFPDYPEGPPLPEGIIFVGGMREVDEFRPESNYGSFIDIIAPADSLTGLAGHTSDNATINSGGNSNAAPMVAGICALLLQENPHASVQRVTEILTQQATIGVLTSMPPNTVNALAYSLASSTEWVTHTDVGSPPYVIDSLEPGTEYEVQVRRTTADGTSDWSSSALGTTAASVEQGEISAGAEADALFDALSARAVSFSAGVEADSAMAGQAAALAAISTGVDADSTLSGRAAAIASITEALEAGDVGNGINAVLAAFAAGLQADAQIAAIAQAAAAIQAGLEAGEDWAAIAAAEAGLLAGAELGATFASETQSAQTAALSAGTEAAASFLGAVAAYGLLSAGAEAGDAFSASAAISGAWSASAGMGAVFGISSSNEVSLTAAAEVQSVFLSVIEGRGGISEPVDAGSAFSGVSSALALLSAGVLLGADFTAVSSADFSVVRAVATVRAIHRISADVRPVGGISTTIH